MGIKLDADEVIGQVFGKLTATEEALPVYHKTGRKLRHFRCSCTCGKSCVISLKSLRSNNTLSCGCLFKEKVTIVGKLKKTHGMSSSRVHGVWRSIKDRCTNPNNKAYEHYGGRGIAISEEWLTFEGFFKDMGDRPSRKHSIERVDNSLGYCKSNCIWVTYETQCRNKRKRTDNKSGTTGVWLVKDGAYWLGAYRDLEGKRISKQYSIKKYGYEQAKQMAIDFRNAGIASLNALGAGYSDSHGK